MPMIQKDIETPQPYTFPYKRNAHVINHVDVFAPPESSKSHLQVILYFHGGGLTVGNRKSWFPRWIYDRAMKAGYAFISADYTLLAPASGYDLLDDIKDLFRYLHKTLNDDLSFTGAKFFIDAYSIIVSGSSAGGLCAYLAAVHASPKPRGVLSLYGQGGDLLSPQYLKVKKEPFFIGREMLDPEPFRPFLYPFPPDLEPTSDSPLAYHPADHPTDPGMPVNLRMQLCRLYLQLGVFLDYYTGEWHPSLSEQLRPILEQHFDPETGRRALRPRIVEKHIPLFPQFLIDSSFPPTFLIHGELDSAVHATESQNVSRLLNACGVKNSLRIVRGQEHSFDYADGATEEFATLFDEAFNFVEGVFRKF